MFKTLQITFAVGFAVGAVGGSHWTAEKDRSIDATDQDTQAYRATQERVLMKMYALDLRQGREIADLRRRLTGIERHPR